MSNGEKETVSITFKKRPFANDFRIKSKDGKVLSALCKYYFEVEYHDCMREGCALKSICFFQESVTFIHQSTFAHDVGLQSIKT